MLVIVLCSGSLQPDDSLSMTVTYITTEIRVQGTMVFLKVSCMEYACGFVKCDNFRMCLKEMILKKACGSFRLSSFWIKLENSGWIWVSKKKVLVELRPQNPKSNRIRRITALPVQQCLHNFVLKNNVIKAAKKNKQTVKSHIFDSSLYVRVVFIMLSAKANFYYHCACVVFFLEWHVPHKHARKQGALEGTMDSSNNITEDILFYHLL